MSHSAASSSDETTRNPDYSSLSQGTSDRVSSGDQMATSYGFQKVGDGQKQPLVNEVFHKVASQYDLMNDLMSGGMHRIWKNAMVSALNPPKSGKHSWKCLDVAGGTGDIAMRIVEASNRTIDATVFDINSSMLAVGNDRAAKAGMSDRLEFIEGNAEELPFESSTFNAYTIAFGIRNVPDIKKALKEAYRVLKPGGRFCAWSFQRLMYRFLIQSMINGPCRFIPKIGQMVTGDGEPYQYLVESVRKFPNQQLFANMISEAGF